MKNEMLNRFKKAWPIFATTLLIGMLFAGAFNPFIWETGYRITIGIILLIESIFVAAE